eukprot:TRINITY_DN42242_c0_g1_i2.p1 TRINITY_DN42242_c0_g1~~TRINITY_DN42242_c0_g1_i2.p1  ORF type:complete len:404 (-),score=134.75 TRINITY_DN42242_c0_g1_i2:263-1474(-)
MASASLRVLVASGSLHAASAVRATMKDGRMQVTDDLARSNCCCQKMEEGDDCGYEGFAGAFNAKKYEIQGVDGTKYCCKGRSSECAEDDKYTSPIRDVLKGGEILANPYTCELYAPEYNSKCCCMETGGETGKTCLRKVKEDGKKTLVTLDAKEYCCKTREEECDAEEDRYHTPIDQVSGLYEAGTCVALHAPQQPETPETIEEEAETTIEDDSSEPISGDEKLSEEEEAAKRIQEYWRKHKEQKKPTEPEVEDIATSAPTSSPADTDDEVESVVEEADEDESVVEENSDAPLDVTALFTFDDQLQKDAYVKGMDLLCCCQGRGEISPGVRCTLEDKENVEGPMRKHSCGKKGATWHSLLTIQGHSKYKQEAWTKKCMVSPKTLAKFPEDVKDGIIAYLTKED